LCFAFIIHSSFESIEREGRANVLNETYDEKIPPTTFVILLEALPLLQIARKGFEWVNEGSKWFCKVGECNETYVAK
jgi:hypothetical protein